MFLTDAGSSRYGNDELLICDNHAVVKTDVLVAAEKHAMTLAYEEGNENLKKFREMFVSQKESARRKRMLKSFPAFHI